MTANLHNPVEQLVATMRDLSVLDEQCLLHHLQQVEDAFELHNLRREVDILLTVPSITQWLQDDAAADATYEEEVCSYTASSDDEEGVDAKRSPSPTGGVEFFPLKCSCEVQCQLQFREDVIQVLAGSLRDIKKSNSGAYRSMLSGMLLSFSVVAGLSLLPETRTRSDLDSLISAFAESFFAKL